MGEQPDRQGDAERQHPKRPTAIAVVVVHGIGNQQPMGTVRALVDNLFGEESDLEHPAGIEVRLDRDADFLDLRRLVLIKSGERPRTDFFELYWQPIFGTGKPSTVLMWMLRMLRSNAQGPQMRQVVTTLRAFIALLVLLGAAAAAAVVVFVDADNPWLKAAAAALPVIGAVAGVAKALAANLLATVVADASRYFAPSVSDIEQRDRVREAAIELLMKLHQRDEDGNERYAQIVVVGHSLGSVVAYDAIRFAFDELRRPETPQTGTLQQVQPHAWNFVTAEPGRQSAGAPALPTLAGRDYQTEQTALHDEQQRLGVPWIVTDFVTVGSPLTHARDLLVTDDDDFEALKTSNALPGCPPIGERQNREEDWARSKDAQPAAGTDGTGPVAFYRQDLDGPLVAHEASPFATTRWTNLYFPMTWWLGGDPVGGPIAPVFGRGVVDIPVEPSAPPRVRKRLTAIPVVSHIKYWRRTPPGHETPAVDCVAVLRAAIGADWNG